MAVVAHAIHVSPVLRPALVVEVFQISGDGDDAFGLELVALLLELLVYKTLDVVLVRRPQARCFIPDSVEGSASDHQILRTTDSKCRKYLDARLYFLRLDLKEIHLPSFLNSFQKICTHLVPQFDVPLVSGCVPQREESAFPVCVVGAPDHAVENIVYLLVLVTGGVGVLGKAEVIDHLPEPIPGLPLVHVLERKPPRKAYKHLEERAPKV